MKPDYEHKPIFITGTARSGASMIAGILDICDAFGGSCFEKPNNSSPRSLMENKKIHDKILLPYFQKFNADSFAQYPLPKIDDLVLPFDWQSRVLKTLHDDGYKGDRPWFYKSPKLALTYPVWNYAFPNAKWVIVRRRTGDILDSCLKTGYMKAFKKEKNERDCWKWYVHEFENRFVSMMTEGLNVRTLWPERMVNGDYGQLYDTIDWLGLKWKTEILSYIDPKFWKVRRR